MGVRVLGGKKERRKGQGVGFRVEGDAFFLRRVKSISISVEKDNRLEWNSYCIGIGNKGQSKDLPN